MQNYNLKFKIVILAAAFGLTFALNSVFKGAWILPQDFRFGSMLIHYYGIIVALAVAGSFHLAKKRADNYGIDPQTAENIIFWLIIGGFLGARLYHVFSSFGYYRRHLPDIIRVWQGGLSIYGAVLGGLIALWLCKLILNYKFEIINLSAWLTPPLIAGQIIGRFGNLFNYEAFGYPTSLPWKMFVPPEFRPESYRNFDFFHPWFLYEQLGLVIIFLIIKKARTRRLFLLYFLLYNILRFLLEFLRIDGAFLGSFRLNSLMSLMGAFFSLILLVRARHHAEIS